jgi:hypothetical protein
MEPTNPIEQGRAENVGDAWTMLVVNVVLIGFLTASMVQGPYSSREQEVWYRFGSLGFFTAGVVLPAAGLFAIRRSRLVIAALNTWMLAVLLAFLWFGAMSSGGV